VKEALRAAFRERFGHARSGIAEAPGRVNLIGEHTDYNEGFVLPVAIDRYVRVAFAPSPHAGLFRGVSVDFGEGRQASYDEFRPISVPPSWFDYAAGVAWALGREGVVTPGLDFVVAGDIPIGAGLSSSAALEIAVARALFDAAGVTWDGRRAARLGQRVENDYIGLESGIMDQMASALSQEGAAMLLDCRSLDLECVPLPDSLAIVVLDTGTRRSLADSAYNERRASCQAAVRALKRRDPSVRALRDASETDLSSARDEMNGVTYRRALHVVRENERTLEMARALEASDEVRLGELMAGSHESLRDLYEVSSPALDRLVERATSHPACLGARMTGGGFGGCAVALVRVEDVEAFTAEIGGEASAVYRCRAVAGATLDGC